MADMRNCLGCGREISVDARVCPGCGHIDRLLEMQDRNDAWLQQKANADVLAKAIVAAEAERDAQALRDAEWRALPMEERVRELQRRILAPTPTALARDAPAHYGAEGRGIGLIAFAVSVYLAPPIIATQAAAGAPVNSDLWIPILNWLPFLVLSFTQQKGLSIGLLGQTIVGIVLITILCSLLGYALGAAIRRK
jgi:hypothetical protein